MTTPHDSATDPEAEAGVRTTAAGEGHRRAADGWGRAGKFFRMPR